MSTPRSFKQELTCVFGQPVAENPTQAMLEAAYRHHDLDWRYLTIEVAPEQLGDAVRGFRAMNFRGGNLTIPHKVAVIEHLDGLSEAAEKIGAVNCMVWRGTGEDRKLIGENTDGKGFVESLSGVLDPTGRNVVIFGAGGAARAIGVELALAGAEAFTIVNRNEQRGLDLAKRLRDKTPAKAEYVHWKPNYALPEGTDVVVNATSIGLYPEVDARLDFDLDTLRPNMIVADVIPNPPRTLLVQEARERGCSVIDGLGMLVNQGVIGLRLWSGIDPDPTVMRKALEDVFGE
jgi:shikimate dehydrogenase